MHTLNSSSSAADYASLLHSEQASLEAALSFLAECDDASGSGGSGASWRLLQDASSHDMDVDIDEDVDEHHHHHHHYHHHHHQQQEQQHMYGEKPRGQEKEAQDDDDDGDDSDDAAMLSALLEAEHIPVMETITTPGAASSFHDAARAGGYVSFHGSRSSSSSNLYGFADDSPTSDFTPHHNPGMMMAMMSAGFPTIDFNPQSLLMTPNNDSSGSESNSPMASTTASASTATSASASASASTSSPSARASTSSTALVRKRPSKKKPAGYNSNRARDERKEELIYLRKTVSEMEERLNKLKQNTPASVVPPAGTTAATTATATATTTADFSPNSSSSSTTSTNAVNDGVGNVSSVVTATPAQARTAAAAQQLSNSVWEDIATRQYKERRRAELENIRLKLILEGQIKMAKALEKILKKRTSLRILESVRGSGKRVKCVRRPGDGDAEIFRELLAGVEKTLEEVDAVFEANGLGRMQTAYRDAQLRHDDVNGMVMEIFANKVMPFDMQATASAVWRHYGHSMEHIPSRSYYHKQPPYLETTEDTLVESYGLELHGSRTKGNFLCKQIMRKFEQQERIVIGWRAQAEAVDLSAEPTAGIRLVERGYTVIKELENMATPHTLVQTCYIIRPHVYDAIADQDRKVGALTDFIMNCMAGTISASHQMIENFLLDQALKSK